VRKPPTITITIEPSTGQGQDALIKVLSDLIDDVLKTKGSQTK
jgi:hypothetical protein